MALSFQKRAGCDKICAVQGKDPSVHFAHNLVKDSEDDSGFGVISESAAPFELLVAELVKLEKTSELVSSCLSRKFRKEKLFFFIGKVLTNNLCAINQ